MIGPLTHTTLMISAGMLASIRGRAHPDCFRDRVPGSDRRLCGRNAPSLSQAQEAALPLRSAPDAAGTKPITAIHRTKLVRA